MTQRIICLLIGYICGMFPTGTIIGKRFGKDLRREGSGNTGATNAFRVMGWKAAVPTFLGDFLKALIPVLLVQFLLFPDMEGMHATLRLYAGLGAILGHDFPAYKINGGGKGVSTTCGAVMFADYRMAPLPILLFIAIVAGTGYVSVGSMSAMLVVAAQGILFTCFGWHKDLPSQHSELAVLYCIVAFICIWQHRSNIRRLINGNENRFGHHKK